MAKTVKKSDVVNRTGGVETSDGRTLFGLDAEIYLKAPLSFFLPFPHILHT